MHSAKLWLFHEVLTIGNVQILQCLCFHYSNVTFVFVMGNKFLHIYMEAVIFMWISSSSIHMILGYQSKRNKEATWLHAELFFFICVHTTSLCVCTPCHCVRAHHVIMCMHTTLCACTPCHHVHAHHVMCVHTMPSYACTPHCVHAHYIIVCVHTTLCACTPHHHVCAHHIRCMHTMPLCVCTPHRVCAHHTVMYVHTTSCACTPHCAHHAVMNISVKSHSKVMWPLISANQKAPFSQMSLTLWEIVRFHPKCFPHLKSKAVITALLKICMCV